MSLLVMVCPLVSNNAKGGGGGLRVPVKRNLDKKELTDMKDKLDSCPNCTLDFV